MKMVVQHTVWITISRDDGMPNSELILRQAAFLVCRTTLQGKRVLRVLLHLSTNSLDVVVQSCSELRCSRFKLFRVVAEQNQCHRQRTHHQLSNLSDCKKAKLSELLVLRVAYESFKTSEFSRSPNLGNMSVVRWSELIAREMGHGLLIW